MIIVLEGLDGAGKTTLLRNTADELFDKNNISSYIISPTIYNPKLKQLIIQTNYSSCKDKFNQVIQEHEKILKELTEFENTFNIIFLDRSIYSAFAYCFYLETDTKTKQDAIRVINNLESEYNLKSYFLNTCDKKRMNYLNQREIKELFDSTDKETTLKIYSEFINLALESKLKFCSTPEHFKFRLACLLKEKLLVSV